ncbi:MAG: chromosomal replication initiator protein DnaA, partial [Candidatus Marinimicrobia bacterium]|nr:chromosomal replication initiator protein DnaA [Candidatus Neomarinimicrobiota bacterium]
MTHETLWSVIYNELAENLPTHAINTWFEPISPVALIDNELVLEVPNQFFFEWIESHYKQNMNVVVSKSETPNLKFRFIVSAEKIEVSDHGENKTIQTKPNRHLRPLINKNYSFETFIEGSNNQFAKSAAESVASDPGNSAFNPLIIYGGVGLGKTHLIHAIGNRILSETPSAKVVLVTSEKFTLDFVNGLRKNKTIEFAKQYRSADVLLIDDIQFFRGKEQTQEQFFHTFNELHQSGRQVVMTADRYPAEMKGLQDRLLSRFQSGLSVDVQPPDFEMRVAILMEKAEQNGVSLPYDTIEFIATHVKSNVRDIEGTIIRILARSSLMNQEIDFTLVREVVKERVGKNISSDLTVEDVVRRVSEISK